MSITDPGTQSTNQPTNQPTKQPTKPEAEQTYRYRTPQPGYKTKIKNKKLKIPINKRLL